MCYVCLSILWKLSTVSQKILETNEQQLWKKIYCKRTLEFENSKEIRWWCSAACYSVEFFSTTMWCKIHGFNLKIPDFGTGSINNEWTLVKIKLPFMYTIAIFTFQIYSFEKHPKKMSQVDFQRLFWVFMNILNLFSF